MSGVWVVVVDGVEYRSAELRIYSIREASMAVYFRCPECQGEHKSRLIQMDRATFENPTNRFEGNSEPCPVTGRQATYDKDRMFWKED